MSWTKTSAAFDRMMEEAHRQADERNMDQLYLEYAHDQACIQRDAVLNLVAGCHKDYLPKALYEYFYQRTTQKP